MKGFLSFMFIVLLAFSACKKKTSDPKPNPASTTTGGSTTGSTPVIDINSTPQVSYSLDGVAVSYVGDYINYAGTFGAGGGGTNYTHLKYYLSLLGRIPERKDVITITRNIIVPTSSTTVNDAAFQTFFPLTSMPYVPTDTIDGINIEIKDANDVLWTTYFGADQTGSTFNIVQTKDEKQNYPYIKTYITFSCKVYNSSGAMKTITNGKYVGHFGIF